jgi:homoserine O-succinyltransferase
MPYNYYIDNDMQKGVRVTWRGHGNLLFTNWLNYYVYQETPYDINAIQ